MYGHDVNLLPVYFLGSTEINLTLLDLTVSVQYKYMWPYKYCIWIQTVIIEHFKVYHGYNQRGKRKINRTSSLTVQTQ